MPRCHSCSRPPDQISARPSNPWTRGPGIHHSGKLRDPGKATWALPEPLPRVSQAQHPLHRQAQGPRPCNLTPCQTPIPTAGPSTYYIGRPKGLGHVAWTPLYTPPLGLTDPAPTVPRLTWLASPLHPTAGTSALLCPACHCSNS